MSDANASPRLKVAVLNRVFGPRGGGAEHYSVQVAQALAARHEVHVFAQDIQHASPLLHYHRVPVAFRKPRWANQLVYAFFVWRATRRGFDVVHSHENTWSGDIQSIHVKSVRQGLFGDRRGFALALCWLKVLTSPRLLTYWLLERSRFTARPGRRVVLASEAMRESIAWAYPEAAPGLAVVTPGVAMPEAIMPRAEARARLGLPADARLLLFVANDYARKGLQALLEALQSLPSDVSLAVAGRADQEAAFRAQAQRLGVAKRVHFLGPQADLSPAYAAADLLVHPTREDSFAMVVLEAMAHGLPVVVSAAPWCGFSAQLRDGRDALLLPDPMDAGALAALVARGLGDEALRSDLRAAGLGLARRHDWATAAADFERLYLASVAERHAAGR